MLSSRNGDLYCENDVENEMKSDLLCRQSPPRENGKKRKFARQLLGAMSPILGSVCIGMTNGITAVLVPNVPHIVNPNDGSWLAGTITLSMLAGNILSSFAMRFFGRKPNLIFSYIPIFIGWICISFATDFSTLLLNCSLIGFGSGVNVPVGLVYYAETCEPELRGLLLGVMVSSVAIGILLVHSLGILLVWGIASQICTVIPIIAFCCSLFIPESPVWLLSKGRIEQAKKNFIWLRGFGPAINETEFNSLVIRQTDNNKSNRQQFLRALCSTQFFRPFFLLILLFSVQQWSGLNVIIFHTVILLRKISTRIDENKCTILIDLLRIASSLLGCYLLKVLKRRTLYFISAAGTIVSMIGIIVASKYDLNAVFLVIALSCYICALHSGVVTLPWLMNSEVYPVTIRDAGIVVSTVFALCLQFVMVKTSIPLIASLGIPSTISIYTIVVLVGSIILYFVMPETKNNTLQEAGDKLTKI